MSFLIILFIEKFCLIEKLLHNTDIDSFVPSFDTKDNCLVNVFQQDKEELRFTEVDENYELYNSVFSESDRENEYRNFGSE